MRLTEQEDQLLKQYLSKILKYRETYDELYDHIITALSHKTTITSFEQTIYDIITDDFGGHDNLMKLEKASKRAAFKDTIRLFLISFIGYFKFPKLLYTVVGAGMTYYFTLHVQLSLWNLRTIGLTMMVLPAIYTFARSVKMYAFVQKEDIKAGRDFNRHKFNRPKIKPSLTGSATIVILTIAALPLMFPHLWLPMIYYPVFVTLFLLFCALYNLSLARFYRNDLARTRAIILAADKL
ncbi:hypothetical protein HDF18_25915 [Mucilaginibacter sp. X5P1]|uniref:hypothetical protein n=1 Tax=Mucilaginibacter sp. X5P1 TaxID=2723088 RepID=UPI00161520DF|nr:hypothetical protein [Mucilaginibacter sp. X5P1]MBB6141767.1 hypothetical protein [Mucilaginibacter sp. X5P1]